MKIHTICRSVVVLLFLSACQPIQSVTITPTTPKLTESFRRYFETDALVTVTGKVFEVKVFEHARVEVAEEGDYPAIRYYTYDLAIAPVHAILPLQLKDVFVKPTDEAWDYFDGKQVFLYPAPEYQKDFVKSATFNQWRSVDQLHAFEYRFVYSNLSNAIQAERGMESAVLDEGMAVVDVVIAYNGTSETIRVDLRSKVAVITDPLDPRLTDMWGVGLLMDHLGVSSVFGAMGSIAP